MLNRSTPSWCRLFGFRSALTSGIHNSLVQADNALLNQSNIHSDGWGVAYYVAGSPHLMKSTSPAVHDRLFHKLSGVVSSDTVLAHLRKATQGSLCISNSHPFQYGPWVFAHNGNIENFEHFRPKLIMEVSPKLRGFILGNTDSEVLFYLLLTRLEQRCSLMSTRTHLADVAMAARETVSTVTQLVGPLHTKDDGPPTKTYLTFILTDGKTMVGHQGGKALFYSTYKGRCSESNQCPHYSRSCENATMTGYVSHLLFSSERIQNENVWEPLGLGEMVGVDWNMFFEKFAPPQNDYKFTVRERPLRVMAAPIQLKCA